MSSTSAPVSSPPAPVSVSSPPAPVSVSVSSPPAPVSSLPAPVSRFAPTPTTPTQESVDTVTLMPLDGSGTTITVPISEVKLISRSTKFEVESDEDDPQFCDVEESDEDDPQFCDVEEGEEHVRDVNFQLDPIGRRVISCNSNNKQQISRKVKFISNSHSDKCTGKPSGVHNVPSVEMPLYPSAEIHCNIFTKLITNYLNGKPESIFAMKDEYSTESLKNIPIMYNWQRYISKITPDQLCCFSQLRAIYWLLILLHKNPIASANVLRKAYPKYTANSIMRHFEYTSEFIADEYKKHGFEFYYFCFVNVKHPFHQAAISNLPLNAVTFEMCAGKDSLENSCKFDMKLKSVIGRESLYNLIKDSSDPNHSISTNVGFSKHKLVTVIREAALKGVGISALSLSKNKENAKINKHLNLSVLTGVASHKNILIPGIGTPVLDSETLATMREEKRWEEYNFFRSWRDHSQVSKQWLEYLYRKIGSTSWCIPKHVISRQTPETVKYICETLMNVKYSPESDWNNVIMIKDNTNYYSRRLGINSDGVNWVLDTDGCYVPVVISGNTYKIIKPYDCDLESIRSRIIDPKFVSKVKVEIILYMISSFLGRGLTMQELNMDRDSSLSLLFSIALYGSIVSQEVECD